MEAHPAQPRHAGIDGDSEFERFVIIASPGLLRGAYLLCGDREQAQDLLQVALIRTLRRWDAITGPPAVYTGAILINLCHDQRRNARRRPVTVPAESVSERAGPESTDSLLERHAILDAARRLPAAQREVMACRHGGALRPGR